MKNTKKITLATVKSFIKKNDGKLFINVLMELDSMTDGQKANNEGFKKAEPSKYEASFGIKGAWFVGSSRDYFDAFEDDKFIGFKVHNSCGSFIIAISKEKSNKITLSLPVTKNEKPLLYLSQHIADFKEGKIEGDICISGGSLLTTIQGQQYVFHVKDLVSELMNLHK